jgi:inorganic pyrophosphatase
MTDESGVDTKVLAVPVDKLTKQYQHVKEPQDLPPSLLAQIKHFFEHYKDLEPGKWVKVDGFESSARALEEITASIKRAQNS